jgi:hypothetical protein
MDEGEDQEYIIPIVYEKSKQVKDQMSDDEEEKSEDEDFEEISDEPVRMTLLKLKALQKKYAHVDYDDIPENDQYEIKHLQKELNKYQPKLVDLEGNTNKQYRTFTLQKLSGFMNTSQIQKKFLQTGEKQGKYMLKP